MPRHGENIYKRKDGRWEGRVLRDHDRTGKTLYSYFYGHSYTEVRRKMTAHRLLTANSLKGDKRIETSLYCSDAAARWLSNKRLKVKASTYARYQNLIENHILPELGQYEVREITNDLIEGYVERLLNSGRRDGCGGLSSKMTTDILTVLKAILKYAGRQGFELFVHFDELTVRKERREMRVLSINEQDKLAELFMQPMNGRLLGIMISLYTGLRLGEVCALKWGDIDFAAQTLHVRATMQRIKNSTGIGGKTIVVITEPKSESSVRDIPIPNFLLTAMKDLRGSPNSFVLSGREERLVEPRTMENYFKRCIQEIGIAPANYHALRHSFATRCVEQGFDIKSLSEILGHSSVNITLDRYVHSSFELKKKNMDKLKMLSCA